MIVCVQCNRTMRPKETGVEFVELVSNPPQPYRLWSGDMLECPECHREVIYTAPTQKPIAEHFEKDFAKRTEHVILDGIVAKDWNVS